MPIIKSAKKRMRQTIKATARNVRLKRDIRTAVKAFEAKPSSKALSAVQSQFDVAVKKNLLEKNTAARRKARYARLAKEAGVKLANASAKKPVTKPAKKPAVKKLVKKTTAKPATKKAPAKKTTTKK